MRDIGKDANCVIPDCSDPEYSNDEWCCDRRHAKDKELWDTLAEGLCVMQEGEIYCDMLMTNLYPKIKTYILMRNIMRKALTINETNCLPDGALCVSWHADKGRRHAGIS